jgi:hypothetical protein
MKKIQIITFALCIATVLQSQTQSEFIIGADWLNNGNQPGGVPYTMTAQDWTNIKDLGLTWGAVLYGTGVDISYLNSALTGAEQNGLKLILNRNQFADPAKGQRWQYHPEYSQQYPSFTGRTGHHFQEPPNIGTLFPDDNQDQFNVWWAQVATDSPGYMAKGLLAPFNADLTDGYEVYPIL